MASILMVSLAVARTDASSEEDEKKTSWQYRFRLPSQRSLTGTPPHEDATSHSYDNLSEAKIKANQKKVMEYIEGLRQKGKTIGLPETAEIYYLAEDYRVVHGLLDQDFISAAESIQIGKSRQAMMDEALDLIVKKGTKIRLFGVNDFGSGAADPDGKTDIDVTFFGDRPGSEIIILFHDVFNEVTRKYGRALNPGQMDIVAHRYEAVIPDWRQTQSVSSFTAKLRKGTEYLKANREAYFLEGAYVQQIMGRSVEAKHQTYTEISLSEEGVVVRTKKHVIDVPEFFYKPEIRPRYGFGGAVGNWHFWHAHSYDKAAAAKYLIRSVDNGKRLTIESEEARRGDYETLSKHAATRRVKDMYGRQFTPESLELIQAVLDTAVNIRKLKKAKTLNLATDEGKMKAYGPIIEFERSRSPIAMSNRELLLLAMDRYVRTSKRILIQNNIDTAQFRLADWLAPRVPEKPQISIDEDGNMTRIKVDAAEVERLNRAAFIEIHDAVELMDNKQISRIQEQNPKYHNDIEILKRIIEAQHRMLDAPETLRPDETFTYKENAVRTFKADYDKIKRVLQNRGRGYAFWEAGRTLYNRGNELENWFQRLGFTILEKKHGGNAWVARFAKLRTAVDIVNERLETGYDPYLQEKTTTLLNVKWMMRMNVSTSLMEVAKSYLSEGELNEAVLWTALYQGLSYVPFLGTLMTVQSGWSGVSTLFFIQFVPGYGQLVTALNLGKTGVEVAGMAILEPLKRDDLLLYYQGYLDPEEGGLITSGQRERVVAPMPALLHPVDPDRALPLDERREKMYHFIHEHVGQSLRQDPEIWYHPEKAPEIWFGPERLGFKNLHEEFQAKEFDYMSRFVDTYVEDWWNGRGIFSEFDEILAGRAKGPDLRNELKDGLKKDYVKGKNIAIQKEIQRQEVRWTALTEEMAQIGGMNVALEKEMENLGDVFLTAGKAAWAEVLEEMPVLPPAVEIIASPRVQEVDSLDPEKPEKADVIWDVNFRAKITGSTKTNPAPWKVVWEMKPLGGPAVRFEKENEVQPIYKRKAAKGKDKYFSEGGQMQVRASAIDATGKQFASGTITVAIEKSSVKLPEKPKEPEEPKVPKEAEKENKPVTAPVLKLVKIDGPKSGEITPGYDQHYVISYNEGETGFRAESNYTYFHPDWIAAMRVTKAPLEIILGKPFEMLFELKKRAVYEPGEGCFQNHHVSSRNKQSPQMNIEPGNSEVVGKDDLHAYCKSSDASKPEGRVVDALVEKDGSTSLRVIFTPDRVENPYGADSPNRRYHYRLDFVTDGTLQGHASGSQVSREHVIEFNKKINERGFMHPEEEPRSSIHFSPFKASCNFNISKISLYYDAIHEGDPHIKSLPEYIWPLELMRPPRDESGRGEEPGDKPEGEPIEKPVGGAKPGREPERSIDPNTLDPKEKDISHLIREWISVAKPPESAVEGNNVQYSGKGNVIGRVLGGVIQSRHETGKADPVFLWNNKRKLDSINHCTMEEYVVARLKKDSISHCAGRYGAVKDLRGMRLDQAKAVVMGAGFGYSLAPGSPAKTPDQEKTVERQKPGPEQYLKKSQTLELTIHSPYVPEGVTLPDLTQKKLAEAKKWLEKNKLQTEIKPGSPAPTVKKSGTIEKQDPAPGTKTKEGSTVTLTIHSNFVDVRIVPDVTGRPSVEARRIVEQAGLRPVIGSGGMPSSKEQAGTVQHQRPEHGTSVAIGSEVSLAVYGPFVETVVVPDLQRLSYEEAKRRLEAVGLSISRQDAGRPNQRNLADSFQKQDPQAGTRVSKGQTVLVWFYGQYVPTREEQVSALDCSGYPGSRAYWDNNAGRPLCGCFDGLLWNLANTSCVTADVRANELCARDMPGTVARGKTPDGKINCECPQGFTWNATRTGCEKLIPPEELCARHFPGSVPTGRDATGRVNCDCPQGFTWTADNKSCVKTSEPIPVEEAQQAHFMGSYVITDPARSYQAYRGVVFLGQNGEGKAKEWIDNKPLKVKYPETQDSQGFVPVTWSYQNMVFTLDYTCGGQLRGLGRFTGQVSGYTNHFILSGHWSNGSPGRTEFRRQ